MPDTSSRKARYGATVGAEDGRRRVVARHSATRRVDGARSRPSVQSPRPVAYDPRRSASAYNDPARYSAARRGRRRRAGVSPVPLVIAILALVGIGTGIYLLLNPLSYDVTINGTIHTVHRGSTIATALDEGLAAPIAGDLLAIDGSLITEGGGDAFSATVNGRATTDAETVLGRDAVVEITDGADVTEDFTSSEEVIPHGQAESDTNMYSYWNGSLHVYVKGEDGLRTTKTGTVSGITVSEQTRAPVDSGYTIYTADVGDDKVIALTFDDGPWPGTTDEILDILEANGAKATFFTIGNQIDEYGAQVRRAHDLGCQVCTHTWDHADGSGQGVNLTYMTAEEQISEVQRGYEAISGVIGTEPDHILRAPGGNYYGELIATLEPYVDAEIGWDVDTEDWRRPGSDAIYEAIMGVQPGQVVLMHDGGGDRSETVEAVRRAIPDLIEQGYRLVTVGDLLSYGVPAAA